MKQPANTPNSVVASRAKRPRCMLDPGRFIECDNEDATNIPSCFSSATAPPCTSTTSLPESNNRHSQSHADQKTGLVVEDAPGHSDPRCKERPQRIQWIVDGLRESTDRLWQRCILIPSPGTTGTSSTSSANDNTECSDFVLCDEDLLAVHQASYLHRLSTCNPDQLKEEASQYSCVYLTQKSVESAKRAVSALCRLVQKVVDGTLDNGFALIRPPGHHARRCVAGGFCLLNNVAVAAQYALRQHATTIQRVLIFDFDIHHGDGTQDAFYDNPHVLYMSVHRRAGPSFFPHPCDSKDGPSHVGIGEGRGRNVNVSWSRGGMGDDEYTMALEKLLLPIAREFDPQLILISAGFDGSEGDVGQCNLSPECFGFMIRQLSAVCPKVVATLEGGYVQSVLQQCSQQSVRALLDSRSPDEPNKVSFLDGNIDPVAARNIQAAVKAHAPFWRCLQNSKVTP